MEKILESLSFTNFLEHIKNDIFKNHLEIYDKIEEELSILCQSNFTCYRANMIIIECRKSDNVDHNKISDYESVARKVGEARVSSKAKINKIIHDIYGIDVVIAPESWMSDDIVYSIGEMLDRISIEYLKQIHFDFNNDTDNKKMISRLWQARVEKYLVQKLEEIKAKGFYNIVGETRTYNL